MDRKELYNRISEMIPVEHPKEKTFKDVLGEALGQFKSWISEVDEDANLTKEKLGKAIDNIKNTNQKILNTVDLVSKGKHAEASRNMYSNLCAKPLFTEPIKEGTIFYRMRTNEKKERFTRKDLFHIPLNKRGLVSTQRYSMPGYPCLYLGKSLAACWEEMNRPSLDNCMFSCFKTEKNMRVLSLRFPDAKEWGEDIYLDQKLEIMPFIIACMIKVDDPNNIYKVEYTIPQLIMECLFPSDVKIKGEPLMGIIYSSVHLNKDFNFPRSIYDNIVIPVQNVESGKDYCPVLNDYFKWTEPTSEEFERIKYGTLMGWRKINEDDLDNYNNSLFGLLEGKIKNYEFDNLSL